MALSLLLLVCTSPSLQGTPAVQWGRRIQWPAAEGPAAREHAAMFAEPARHRAVMLTGSGYMPYLRPLGDAWAFDFETERWSELEVSGDPLEAGGSRRVGVCEDGAFLHGGYGEGGVEVGGLWRVETTEDGLRVQRIEQQDPPPARQLHAFACDASGMHFVAFGGGTQEDLFDDTWLGRRTPQGVTWRQLETDVHPNKRFGFAFAYDPMTSRLLVCGGEVLPAEGQDEDEVVVAHDLWAIDFASEAPTWKLLAEYDQESLPGRRNPAFAFDARSGDLLIWGGTGDGRTALPDLYCVRTRVPGAPVERIPQSPSIPTRASGFGVVDTAGERALLGFGNIATGPFLDLAEVHLRTAPTSD